jgi:L-threonylcarbamoyladenylate synthase
VAVMVADEEMALEYVEINEIAKGIYEKYLPGAVTVISKSRGKIVKKLENDQGCVGMRIIDNQFCLELCKAFGKPITCTSANISNCLTPYSLSEYQKEVPKEKQAMVTFVDGGQLPQLPVSTVVDTTHDSLMIIRLGRVIIE